MRARLRPDAGVHYCASVRGPVMVAARAGSLGRPNEGAPIRVDLLAAGAFLMPERRATGEQQVSRNLVLHLKIAQEMAPNFNGTNSEMVHLERGWFHFAL